MGEDEGEEEDANAETTMVEVVGGHLLRLQVINENNDFSQAKSLEEMRKSPDRPKRRVVRGEGSPAAGTRTLGSVPNVVDRIASDVIVANVNIVIGYHAKRPGQRGVAILVLARPLQQSKSKKQKENLYRGILYHYKKLCEFLRLRGTTYRYMTKNQKKTTSSRRERPLHLLANVGKKQKTTPF